MNDNVSSDLEDPRIDIRDQLINPMQNGEKSRSEWRFRTKHEKLVYAKKDYHAPSWKERGGARDLLMRLTDFGWEPIVEANKVIAMSGTDGIVRIGPSGQLEFIGAPHEQLHHSCGETYRQMQMTKDICRRFDLDLLDFGMWPDKRRDELPIMPNGSYASMLRHMPRVGTMGLDMMLRTCATQTSLEFSSEADMVQKFRVSLALQPLATALFANSPFTEGKPNGFLSYRSHVWTKTDPVRTGMLPFVFEDGFGYERYVDYMLDVPMYSVLRQGQFIDASGQSFRDFLEGKLPALPGERPKLSDWEDHLSIAFPEVRLRSSLEMRGADGSPPGRIDALAALWVGLLYDQVALDAAWDLVKDWDMEDREALRNEVPKLALEAPIPGGQKLADLAKEVLEIAHAGLAARGRLNIYGDDETGFLDPLYEIVGSGIVPAQVLLDKFHGEWGQDIKNVYENGSQHEAAIVDQLQLHLDDLERQTEEIPVANPLFGHNMPPEEVGIPPYTEEIRDEIRRNIINVRVELDKSEPDPTSLNKSKDYFRSVALSIMKWAGRKIDLAVDEAIKSGIKAALWTGFIATLFKISDKLAELTKALL